MGTFCPRDTSRPLLPPARSSPCLTPRQRLLSSPTGPVGSTDLYCLGSVLESTGLREEGVVTVGTKKRVCKRSLPKVLCELTLECEGYFTKCVTSSVSRQGSVRKVNVSKVPWVLFFDFTVTGQGTKGTPPFTLCLARQRSPGRPGDRPPHGDSIIR